MARTRYAVRGLAVVGLAVLAAGLAMPAVAAPGAGARTAASALAKAAAQAAELPEADGDEKARALAAVGIVADGEWIVLPDRSFVSRLLTDGKSAPLLEVRAAARAALDAEGTDAATLFIRSEIFVAVEKDESRIRQEQLAKQQSREAKQRALAYLEIPATPELLDLPDDQFIRRVGTLVTWDWGTRVQAGVNTALRGEAPAWKAFIETGVITAHRADVEAFIQAQHDKTEAEKEALRQKDLKRRAASVVAWVPAEGELALASDNFIRKIEEKAVAGSEVALAALAALRSPEPAVWAAFLETGVHAASARDKQIALDKKAAADRKVVLEIQTKATNSLMHPALAAAAAAALAGTPADVDRFLVTGQYEAVTQSIGTTTPKRNGWWVRSAAGDAGLISGDSAGAPPAPIANATWKVVDGLADESCHSLESTENPGHYLRPAGFRVQLQPSDGSTEFKNAATWCAKKGLTGSGVSLESKSQPGRYLRHLETELWIANNSNQNAFDRSCGYKENASWTIGAPNPVTGPKPAAGKDPCSDLATFGNVKGVNGFCVDVRDGRTEDHSAVQIADCLARTDLRASRQLVTATSDGSLRVLGKCLDMNGAISDFGSQLVQLYTCNGTNPQKWEARPDGSIVTAHNGYCLDGTFGKAGSPITTFQCHDGGNQRWTLPTEPARFGHTVGVNGLCVDVRDGRTEDHTAVQIADCLARTDPRASRQLITLSSDGGLRVLGKCLDMNGAISDFGSQLVQLYTCNGTNPQKWEARADGAIVTAHNGNCLDGTFGRVGSPITTFPCHDGGNQRWALHTRP